MGKVKVGSAPDSWGVWFADDPQQTPWERFLDEVAAAGYTRIELGPYGYLPTDPARLKEELDKRGLTMTAGTIFEHLHRPDSWDSTWRDVSKAAELTAAMGAKHLVVIPSMWRDGVDRRGHRAAGSTTRARPGTAAGDRARPADRRGVRAADAVPPARRRPCGHARDASSASSTTTDGAYVNLCLDTGHISYCGGDNLKLIQDYPDRIGYVHLKQVDPESWPTVRGRGPRLRRGGQARRDVRAADRDSRAATGAGRAGRARRRTCSRSSSRTCTPAHPTSRCRSRSGR